MLQFAKDYKKSFYLFCVFTLCVWVFCLDVSLCITPIAHGGKKKVSDSLGLSYR